MQEHDTDPGPGDPKTPAAEPLRRAPLVHPAAPQVRYLRNPQHPQPMYETDFYAWTQAQAAAIRAGQWEAIDREHVAEEIGDLWHQDRHDSAMLVLGFLELAAPPGRRAR